MKPNAIRRFLLTLSTSLVLLEGFALGAPLPIRPNWTTTITPLPTYRMTQLNFLWGGYNSTTDIPNLGMIMFNAISVYSDAIGQIAWVILLAIPFFMMAIANMDVTAPAIIGMLFSLYVFLKIPQQYIVFSVGVFVLCMAMLLFSLYKRLG